ncbi:MAG: glyoxalase [Chloracidobacterium sp.]|nr:glyoxalase [Chloracidobacterium sp.]
MRTHFIFYVADQTKSTAFYSSVLEIEPHLMVPGMTEFALGNDAVLGLMPLSSASRLLGQELLSSGEPRAEIYLMVDAPNNFHARALAAGAREISPYLARDWGHSAAYSIDKDGNVIAFACLTPDGITG